MNRISICVFWLVVLPGLALHADDTNFRSKLAELVGNGKLTQAEANELQQLASPSDNKPEQSRDVDLKQFGEKLRKAVDAGELTAADAKAKYIAAMKRSGKKFGKGKNDKSLKGKNKSGDSGFYAIVIGRLKTKDIELAEFTMDVDYVSSMYGNRWVKDEIIGKTVTVKGVSGPFLDQLLQIGRGKTLRVRSSRYNPSPASKCSILRDCRKRSIIASSKNAAWSRSRSARNSPLPRASFKRERK